MKGIEVVCMSTRHPNKLAIIAFLFRSERGEWEPRADNLGERQVYLEGNEVVEGKRGGLMRTYPALRSPGVRRHFEASCPLCSFKLSCRGDKLDLELDQMWNKGEAAGMIEARHAGGVMAVPLGLLAARLRSK